MLGIKGIIEELRTDEHGVSEKSACMVHQKGGGGGSTTTVEKADPWSGQQPYLTKGFQRADQLYNSGGADYFPNATYTPFSPQTQTALQLTQGRALAGSPINQSAQNYVGDVLEGQYLPGNPYLDKMYDRAADSVTRNYTDAVTPSINATFGAAGRTGGGLHQQAFSDAQRQLGENLSGMATDMYGQNYADERKQQMQALAFAPQVAASDYADFDRLAQVGQRIEGQAGNILGDQRNRFDFYQNRPEENLQRYIAAIQGNYGGSSTSTVDQNIDSNPIAGALGGAMAGSALGPWGMAGGAILGGLFS